MKLSCTFLIGPDCETDGKRKACKNCSCGLAEELEREAYQAQAVKPPTSSCGSVRFLLAYFVRFAHPEHRTLPLTLLSFLFWDAVLSRRRIPMCDMSIPRYASFQTR